MAKNIVVCCDGTGNEYGSNNTNVVKLYEAIVRDRDQAAFYDPASGPSAFSAGRSDGGWADAGEGVRRRAPAEHRRCLPVPHGPVRAG